MENKKIVFINIGNYGSTGKIVEGLAEISEKEGYEVLKCYPKSSISGGKKKNDYIICSELTHKINRHLALYTGFAGYFAAISTLKLIHRIKRFNPDLIHLHNLHGDYINLPLLFRYLKKRNSAVVWTLHDCWSFTGRCPYFQMSKCNKWKTGCFECPFPANMYPQSNRDTSRFMWRKKKLWFSGLKKLVIVTPSKWMARVAEESFMNEYPIKVIYNGIDLNVFKPTPSDIRERLIGIGGGYIVLGVAMGWSVYKGIDIFISLDGLLDENYHIMLVGVDEKTKEMLPDRIIAIDSVTDQEELAKIYTSADVLLNPTREEVLGLTNLEALACGTPVITFNTGGSPECIDSRSGRIIADGELQDIVKEIHRICGEKDYSEECVRRAYEFDESSVYLNYIDSYGELIKSE